MKYDPEARQQGLAHIAAHGLAPTHRRIIGMVGRDRKVLDLGCATGYLAEALAANGCEVSGVEKDAEAADAARAFCREVMVGDAGDLDVLERIGNGFDVIVCADIIEHLVDPWSVLRILREMIVPDGEIIVSVPNVAYWRMRLHLLSGHFTYTGTGLLDRTHLRFFTVQTFHQAARECGLTVADMTINDAGLPGFPHPVDWDRLPGWVRTMVGILPNLCVFHAIYRLRPERGG